MLLRPDALARLLGYAPSGAVVPNDAPTTQVQLSPRARHVLLTADEAPVPQKQTVTIGSKQPHGSAVKTKASTRGALPCLPANVDIYDPRLFAAWLHQTEWARDPYVAAAMAGLNAGSAQVRDNLIRTIRSVYPNCAGGAEPARLRNQPAYGPQPLRTIDAMLRSCPTAAEMLAIRTDFNIFYGNDVPTPSFPCTPGGAESSVQLTMYNAFRALRLVNFNAPMPVTGSTNLYEWMFAQHLTSIGVRTDLGYSRGEDGQILIRSDALAWPSNRVWYDPSQGAGLLLAVGLLVHETRHAMPGGPPHDCNAGGSQRDSSLSYNGAFAVQYWYYRWCADHAPGYFTAQERDWMRSFADELARNVFCDRAVAP